MIGILPVKDSRDVYADYCLDEYINISKYIVYLQYGTDTGMTFLSVLQLRSMKAPVVLMPQCCAA